MRKTFITLLTTFFIISGILVADYFVNSDFVMVKTKEVSEDYIKKYISATGVCYEQNKREIRVDLPFAIDKIYVSVGERISKGQKIIKLDKENIRGKLEMQSLTVSSISNDNLLAKINNYESEVKSPIDGIVTKINVSEGGLVNSNLPVMVVSDLENLVIKASIPESIIGEIFVGQNVLISAEYFENSIFGQVVKIHPVAERNEAFSSQSFVTVDVAADSYENIRPQTTLKVEFEKEKGNNSVVIPFDSVVFDEENPYVFINNMGYAAKRYVNLGEEFDIDVEIISGVKKGDLLIVNPGREKIKEGDKLLTVNEEN